MSTETWAKCETVFLNSQKKKGNQKKTKNGNTECQFDVIPDATGSIYVESGNTKMIVAM